MEILTQINEKRCLHTYESHSLDLPVCCPISHNPRPGSRITISYIPGDSFIEVASLKRYIDSYIGGKGEIRSMEGMLQQIAQDCSNAIKATVKIVAELVILPNQQVRIQCKAYPATKP